MTLLFLSVWSVVSANGGAAAMVQQPAEQALWQLSGNAFHCQLQQDVSGLGQVRFVLQPGHSLQLQLAVAQPHDALEQASVVARSAQWQPFQPEVLSDSYQAELYHDSQISFVRAALPLLQQVQAGAWLQFSLGDAADSRSLLLPSTRGAQAIAQFRACVAQMSPLSWQQARETDLYFATGKRLLDAEQLRQLQKIARYTELDPAVTKILIDGHTDDVGTVLANRVLSQQRADEVAAQLMDAGVKAGMLEVRAHGNRYPLILSQGKAEQSNRRVSVRLIRQTDKAGASKP